MFQRPIATRTKTLVLVTAWIALALAACSRRGGTEYFPQARIGSRFEYSVAYSAAGSGAHKARMVSSVTGRATVNGQRYYKIVSVFSGLPGLGEQIQYLRWTREGVYEADAAGKDPPEYLDTPFPISIGSTWLAQSPGGRTRYKAMGTETVTVGGRTYRNCLKLAFAQQLPDGVNQGTSYSAPNIGMVMLMLHTDNGVDMTFTLDKYKR